MELDRFDLRFLFFEVRVMDEYSGALMEGLAAFFSMLSCGIIAGAAKKQNLRKPGNNVIQTIGKKKQVKKVQAKKEAN